MAQQRPLLSVVETGQTVGPTRFDDYLIEPPAAKLGGLAIAVVGLIVVMLIANVVAYSWSNRELENAVNKIVEPAAAEASP